MRSQLIFACLISIFTMTFLGCSNSSQKDDGNNQKRAGVDTSVGAGNCTAELYMPEDCVNKISVSYPCKCLGNQCLKVHHVTTGGLDFPGNDTDGKRSFSSGSGNVDETRYCVERDLNPEVLLTGNFYITVPCDRLSTANVITDIDGTGPKYTYNGNPIGDTKILTFMYRNGLLMDDVDFSMHLLKPTGAYRLSSNFTLTDTSYIYTCLNEEDTCAALVNVAFSYTAKEYSRDINDNLKRTEYHLVFYIEDHGSPSYHSHNEIVKAADFKSVELLQNHKGELADDFFERVDVKEKITTAKKKKQNKVEPSIGSSTPQPELNPILYTFQEFLDLERSGTHEADHIAIIRLPGICLPQVSNNDGGVN